MPTFAKFAPPAATEPVFTVCRMKEASVLRPLRVIKGIMVVCPKLGFISGVPPIPGTLVGYASTFSYSKCQELPCCIDGRGWAPPDYFPVSAILGSRVFL